MYSPGNPNQQGTWSLSLFLKRSTCLSIFHQMEEIPERKLSPWSTLQLRLAHHPRDKAWPQARQKKDQDPSVHARHYSPGCWVGSNYHVPGCCASADRKKCSREPRALFTRMCIQSSSLWWLKPAGVITAGVAACTSFSCVQDLQHFRNMLGNLICFQIQVADKKELDDLNMGLRQVECQLIIES